MKLFIIFLLFPMFSMAQNIETNIDGNVSVSGKIIYHNQKGEAIDKESFSDSLKTSNYGIRMEGRGDKTLIYLDSKYPDISLIKGKKLPACHFTDINGKAIDTASNNEDITLICFWSTTCPPCIEELIVLNIMVKEYSHLKILAITPDSSSDIKKFMDTRRFAWNNLTIITDYNHEYQEVFEPKVYPFSVLVDTEGTIRNVFDRKDLRKTMQWLNQFEKEQGIANVGA